MLSTYSLISWLTSSVLKRTDVLLYMNLLQVFKLNYLKIVFNKMSELV